MYSQPVTPDAAKPCICASRFLASMAATTSRALAAASLGSYTFSLRMISVTLHALFLLSGLRWHATQTQLYRREILLHGVET